MKVLLDTCALLWFLRDDPELSEKAAQLIESPDTEAFVSVVSIWEIAIKVGKNKLDLTSSYDDFMRQGIEGNDFTILPIDPKHTSLLTTMIQHHNDPFDRMIIAQAMAEQVPVVGVDSAFDAYGVTRLW